VGTFEGLFYLGVHYKVWMIIAQMIGYGLAKFIGIKIISELHAAKRLSGILIMIGIAGVSWLFFAITPAPYNIVFLFTNGLPLGMGWGLVFSYLEGRRVTEVLGAGVSVSFIFASGFSKSVGGFVMLDWNVAENWMPFVSVCLFLIPLLIFLWLIDKLPAPSIEDEEHRTKRLPMNKVERWEFMRSFAPGMVLLILTYVLLTAFRDFRDNFAAEVWGSLGYGNSPEIFTQTETPITLAVLIIMGSIVFIKNNNTAFVINHFLILIGMILVGVATFLFDRSMINAPTWMILLGLGLYLGYVPFNSILFERLLATFKYVGTVGFLIYVADSFGYVGSIGVMLYKEFGHATLSWLEFFIGSGYVMSLLGTVLIVASFIYFRAKYAGIEKDA
jgi:hypothetical protein